MSTETDALEIAEDIKRFHENPTTRDFRFEVNTLITLATAHIKERQEAEKAIYEHTKAIVEFMRRYHCDAEIIEQEFLPLPPQNTGGDK